MTIDETRREAAPAASQPADLSASPNWFAALGLVAGLGAVVASSCCVIPLALAALGAGASVLGGLEWVAAWRVPLLSISALAILGGWGSWRTKRPIACVSGAGCATPQRSCATLALLLCASITMLTAASWSYIDPALFKLLRGR